jgi:UDP-N-acetylglucosamine 2-epimerase (non-hydrolysing)
MKIMTILGTRPEIIRLSLIIDKLDQLADRHIVVHTGQNYDRNLSDVFFEQMDIRLPDIKINLSSHSLGQQIGEMFTKVEQAIRMEKPDKILVLGDTNSALCAILGERMGVPVYHMEAGNRCYDTTVPEEINRKIIDSISSYNLPYTELSRENLLREGIPSNRIWVSGNPIYEVLSHYEQQIDECDILQKSDLNQGEYIVVTSHRAENVDHQVKLQAIVDGLDLIAKKHKIPVICSIHPRTLDRLSHFGMNIEDPHIKLCEPFGFFDFVKLQKHAACVITDSGTVQEESCIFGVPSVTIRQSTERPETLLCGSNTLSGLNAERIANCVDLMIKNRFAWTHPEGYIDPHVSTKVVHFLLGGQSYV